MTSLGYWGQNCRIYFNARSDAPQVENQAAPRANYRPQGGPWHVALTFCSIEGRNQHLIINFIHMSSDMKLRGDLILSLRARSTALEKLLEHLNCSIRGEVSRVQDRANFDICSSVLASNSHVVGSYTSCGTRAYNTQFQPVRIARVTQPRLHGKRPHLGIDQLPIITNQNCSVKKCQEMSARSFGTSLKDTTAIDNAFDEIRNVYYIDSGEMRKRNSAAKCIETLVRCWLVRHRYNVFLEKIKVMQQSNAQRLLRAVSESAVRCRELDLGITRIMRRRCRKVLFEFPAFGATRLRPTLWTSHFSTMLVSDTLLYV